MFLLLMDNKLRKTGSQVLANVWCLNSPETRSTPFCNHSLHFGGLTTKNLQKNNNQRAGWGNPNCIREKEENTKEKKESRKHEKTHLSCSEMATYYTHWKYKSDQI